MGIWHFVVTITKVMEVDVRGRPEVSAGSMSLHTSLLMGGIIYLGTISKLLNELIEADSGVLSVHLVGLLILDKNLVKAFGLVEDGIHESDELGVIVLVRLEFA